MCWPRVRALDFPPGVRSTKPWHQNARDIVSLELRPCQTQILPLDINSKLVKNKSGPQARLRTIFFCFLEKGIINIGIISSIHLEEVQWLSRDSRFVRYLKLIDAAIRGVIYVIKHKALT